VLASIGRPDGDAQRTIREIATTFLYLNLLLAVFNLVPLPPLDGAGIVGGLFPKTRRIFEMIQSVPYSTLVVFVLMSRYLGQLFRPVYLTVDGWLPYSTLF
jgi:Zn-dependent protease